MSYKPIGIFDSGYGGLTIMKEIVATLPQYDYVYFGDNARVPYGNRSFEAVHEFTWQCVQQLFAMSCPLVILACNTASAKALRTIQQKDLPQYGYSKKVLGVIRPTSEIIGHHSKSRHVGILATKGTVLSDSYVIEINKFFPDIKVFQQACPMWVPLIENNEHNDKGADYFVEKYLDLLLAKSPHIDTIVLACTHYPLLIDKIKTYLPSSINIVSQGPIVAQSLEDYLSRHQEIDNILSKEGKRRFFTTDDTQDFDAKGKLFLGHEIQSEKIMVSK